MKIQLKEFEEEGFKCPECNWKTSKAYKLDNWAKAHFLCANCFLRELIREQNNF